MSVPLLTGIIVSYLLQDSRCPYFVIPFCVLSKTIPDSPPTEPETYYTTSNGIG